MDDKVKDNRLSDVDLEKVSGGVQGNGDGTDWNDSDITGGRGYCRRYFNCEICSRMSNVLKTILTGLIIAGIIMILLGA